MVDGGVEDNDDGDLRSIDLATLSGVLRVCDVELLLLDGNGPRAAFASRVHEEALFCSVTCGFHCRGRFMLPPDWAMLGYLHTTDDALSWCHGVPLTPGMALTVMPEGISEFTLSPGTQMTLMLVPVARVQRKLTELSLRSTPPAGQALSLFNLGDDAMPLVRHYQQLHAQLGQGGGAAAGRNRAPAARACPGAARCRPRRSAQLQPRPPHALPDRAAGGELHAPQSSPQYLHE